jgi:predicted nucleic acid-binding protein
MNYKKVFVDANVLIDLFDTERPLREYSIKAIQKLLENGAELYTSCDLITTIYYVLKKKFKKEALTFIEKLAMVCNLVAFSNEELEEAINLMRQNSNFKDLEDTLQYLLAKRVECDLILSNDGGFYSPDIKVLSAKKLLEED